eukprot:CAMPEP_0204531016 /NCGR_PEP_ID=MMETSP0661-20131031/10941_1 /ASSEMBLY_ACC=CAM_ASM_000606 /TAXON_ID=109239 /ORGANISM="Alexandrium margalefi, Strain AMGDE01CS-322" /LENGTH=311 /DNA_ID=CAMNT_0051537143 /DNA_START=71 /DNA_END=1006 /DNA_ORIENTATION=+
MAFSTPPPRDLSRAEPEVSDDSDLGVNIFSSDGLKETRHQIRQSARLQRGLLFILSLSAIIYVWSLPALSGWCGDFPAADGMPKGHSCFAYRCDGYPACSDSHMGLSVSGFIMTPPATGMMLLTFLWPLVHLLRIDDYVVRAHAIEGHKWTFKELLCLRLSATCYILAFGLFCTCTANYFPTGHNVFMGLTFVLGAIHYVVVMFNIHGLKMWGVQVVLGIAILTFVTVVIMNALSLHMKEVNPYLFYVVESIGLSAMAVYPNVFELGVFVREGVLDNALAHRMCEASDSKSEESNASASEDTEKCVPTDHN